MKEVQLLKAESTQVFDTMRITVNNADGGTYLLVFTDADNENTKSADISTTASAGDMKNAVKNYYSRNRFLKSGINVNMTMYDVDGNVTTVAENATQRVYHIVMTKLINGVSASKITMVKKTTKSDVVVELSENV